MKITSPKTLTRIAGATLILLALAIELLPFTSAGIGPMQIGLMLLGAFIMLLSQLQLNISLMVFSILLTIALIEVMLAFAGIQPNYQAESPLVVVDDFMRCDDQRGCYVDAQGIAAYCDANRWQLNADNRLCNVNTQGYHDSDEFTADAIPEENKRVLLLGDSFTWGATTERGTDYAAIMQRELDTVTIWNTGIPFSGTAQAHAIAQTYAPILQPDLILLAFYTDNDFEDNLYPLDKVVYVSPNAGEGEPFSMRTVQRTDSGEMLPLEPMALYYRSLGFATTPTGYNAILQRSRIVSLVTRLLLQQRESNYPLDAAIPITRDYLAQLQQLADENNADFMVLLIPDYRDLDTPSPEYTAALDLMQSLEIPYVDVRDALVTDDYYQLPNDTHWNTSGHAKVGDLMTDCVRQWLFNGKKCTALR